MCGRFAQHSSLSVLKKSFEIQTVTCEVTPSYNIAPTQRVPAIIHRGDQRLGVLHWGLVPSWARDTSRAFSLINARAETLEDKPSFCRAYEKRRCLILADGFYEWKSDGRQKQPWYFTLKDGGPFAFAGLWETWKGDEGCGYHSCTIVTIEADESMRKIHHRMPVILLPDMHAAWLDTENRDPKRLNKIIEDGRVRKLKYFPVSKRVNSPLNNDPSCIEPVNPNIS